jgi:hypothetical protein
MRIFIYRLVLIIVIIISDFNILGQNFQEAGHKYTEIIELLKNNKINEAKEKAKSFYEYIKSENEMYKEKTKYESYLNLLRDYEKDVIKQILAKEQANDNTQVKAEVRKQTLTNGQSNEILQDTTEIYLILKDLNMSLTESWIELPQNMNETEKINIIKDEVRKLYDKKNKNGNQSIQNTNNLHKTNDSWHIATKLYFSNWRDTLNKLQSNLTHAQSSLNLLLDSLYSLKIAKTKSEARIKELYDAIEIEKKKLSRAESKIKDNKNDIRSKLASIPKSIILVGRIERDEELQFKDNQRILNNAMLNKAELIVKGQTVIDTKDINNSTLLSLGENFFSILECISTIEESSPESNTKNISNRQSETVQYIYSILRIEVYRNAEPRSETTNLVEQISSQHIEIWDPDSLSEEVYSNLKLNENEKDFIKKQQKFIEYMNPKHSLEKEKAINEFIKTSKSLDNEINKITNQINKLINDTIHEKRKLNGYINSISIINSRINEEYISFENLQKKYYNFYNKKYLFLNKKEVEQAEERSDHNSTPVVFSNMAEKIYENVNDLSTRESSTVIYQNKKEKTDEDYYNYNFIQRTITYNPQLEAFRIINLNTYKENNPMPGAGSQIDFAFLNIAFRYKQTFSAVPEWKINYQERELREVNDGIVFKRFYYDITDKINEDQYGQTGDSEMIQSILNNNRVWLMPDSAVLIKLGSYLKNHNIMAVCIDLPSDKFVWGSNTRIYGGQQRIVLYFENGKPKTKYQSVTESAIFVLYRIVKP